MVFLSRRSVPLPQSTFLPLREIGVVLQPRLKFAFQKLPELRMVLNDVAGCFLFPSQIGQHRGAGGAGFFQFDPLRRIGAASLLIADFAACSGYCILSATLRIQRSISVLMRLDRKSVV